MKEFEWVRLYLSSGRMIVAYFDEDDYDQIYSDWVEGKIMIFENCQVKASEVQAIEWTIKGDD